METLDLLKQQGNQAGPEMLKAIQNGEITVDGIGEKAFENCNQCSPDILEALQENSGENVQKAFEQGNQSMPNLTNAYEAGELEPTLVDSSLAFTMPEGGTITLVRGKLQDKYDIEYSNNGIDWTIWEETFDGPSNLYVRELRLLPNKKVYIRNAEEEGERFTIDPEESPYTFDFSAETYASGDVTSLIKKYGNVEVLNPVCFKNLFYRATNLKSLPELTFRAVAELACYGMFEKSGVEGKVHLDLDFIAPDGCKQMFKDTQINELFLACHEIHDTACAAICVGCSQLLTAEVRIPDIMFPAEQLVSAFEDCTALNSITYFGINLDQHISSRWVENVAPLGNFYCDRHLEADFGSDGIPKHWTRIDKNPNE